MRRKDPKPRRVHWVDHLAQPQPSRRTDSLASDRQPAVVSEGGRAIPAGRPEEVSAGALSRAEALAEETGHELLTGLLARSGTVELQPLNNALMDVFRVHGHLEAFTLLFELNSRPFSVIASRIMRMTGCRGELSDILQEAFLAIYRYPTRFCPDKPNAFRNWSYSIIRNTIYRHLQTASREAVPVDVLAEILADESAVSPALESEQAETAVRRQRTAVSAWSCASTTTSTRTTSNRVTGRPCSL
jgi:RNA polymerase sigma factor (sigma-70 family)